MLHFVPDTNADHVCAPYAEAVARLAGLRHALGIVDPVSGDLPGPSDEILAFRWANSSEAERRCFDERSMKTAMAAADGLEALLATGNSSEVARQAIAEEIRIGLEDLSRLMRA
jgi:hypothetical protein